MSITVFLADDHAVMRDGLKLLLETQKDIQVVGAAGDGREAVRLVAKLRPQVAFMDISMPQLNGIEAARQLREVCPGTKLIILSMHSSSEHVLQALQAGARGYLLKAAPGREVVQAVRAVHAGNRYLSKKIADEMIDNFLMVSEGANPENPLAHLSSREREVLQLVAEGHSSTEIAQILPLSPRTVETYRSRLMKKLGLKDRAALIKFAIRHGIVSAE
jgi:two-component system, NarL family, response regulator NreC